MANGPTQRDEVREQIEDEAASWFLRVTDDPNDPQLRDQVAAWRGQSALHQEIWDRTCSAYDVLGKTPPAHEDHWKPYASSQKGAAGARDAATVTRFSVSTPRRSTRKRRVLASAAVAALAACIAFLVLPGLLVRWNADIVTSTAEVRVLDLEDGSRVHLAPESAVDVAFTDGERRIRLLAGRAFFEVKRDVVRPFTVVSGDFVTTVLGTKFDVHLANAGISVAVREGQVRVVDQRRPSAAQDLRSGDMLRWETAGGPTLATIPASDVGDWSEGRLVVRHRPVAEVVDRLRGYYGGVIVINDSAFAHLEVSGVYDPKDPVTTLDNLARLHGATLRRLSPWLVIVTRF
jgi:transmembrane sensor